MAVIRYLVNDVDVALEFYIDILGFELVEKRGPPFAMVNPSTRKNIESIGHVSKHQDSF